MTLRRQALAARLQRRLGARLDAYAEEPRCPMAMQCLDGAPTCPTCIQRELEATRAAVDALDAFIEDLER